MGRDPGPGLALRAPRRAARDGRPRPPARGLVPRRAAADTRTPVRIAEDAGVRFDVAPKAGLLAHSIAIERRAHASRDPLVVFGCFQSAHHFTPDTGRRYRRLAADAAFVGAFGVGLGPEPVPGVRGAELAVNEGLAGEWNVLVVGPHDAAALIARDLGDDGPDRERQFAYALVEDRDVVLAAARSLMLRVMGG